MSFPLASQIFSHVSAQFLVFLLFISISCLLLRCRRRREDYCLQQGLSRSIYSLGGDEQRSSLAFGSLARYFSRFFTKSARYLSARCVGDSGENWLVLA